MRFKNTLSIVIDNFVNVFKMLLYRLVTDVIFFSLVYVILTLSLKGIVKSAEATEIFRLIKEFFSALVSGNVEYLSGFQALFNSAVAAFWEMLKLHIGSIVWSVVGICLLYLCGRFANGLCVFAVGHAVNDRMQVYAHAKFSTAYFKNLGKAALDQIIYVPMIFVYDVLTVLLCYFFFFYALSFLPLIITIAMAVTGIVCLQALKFTVISAWLPAVIADDERVCAAMRKSFARKQGFGKRFVRFLVVIYMIIVLNVTVAVCTLGSGLLLTVPVSFLLLLCMQFVNYFEDEKKKYFIAYDKIVNAEKKADVIGE